MYLYRMHELKHAESLRAGNFSFKDYGRRDGDFEEKVGQDYGSSHAAKYNLCPPDNSR